MFLKKIFKNIFPSFSQENPVTNSASVPPLPPIFAPFFHFKRVFFARKILYKNDERLQTNFRYFEKKFENLTERTACFYNVQWDKKNLPSLCRIREKTRKREEKSLWKSTWS